MTVQAKIQAAVIETLGISEDALRLIWASPSARAPIGVGPLYIYLDLNHWVSLAKARVGHKDGVAVANCYRLLRQGVQDGQLVLPLSATHYMEVENITNFRQRTDLANVMAELSRFRTIAGHGKRMPSECEAALHREFGTPEPSARLQPSGIGFSFAFGMRVVGRIVSKTGGPLPSQYDPAEVKELEYLLNQVTEYVMLRGPRPEEISQIPDYVGPEVTEAIAEERARREQELAELLKVNPNRVPHLEDIVHARGLYWEMGHLLPDLLARAGVSLDSFYSIGNDRLTAFLDDIPCMAVQSTLTMQTFKNGSRRWTTNDIHDIDGLGAAVPYCDVVVTEKYAWDVLNKSQLPSKYGTTILRRLRDLESLLSSFTEQTAS